VWRTLHFSQADLLDPSKEATVWGNWADPDHDGRHNWYEYVFGGVPTTSDAAATELAVDVVFENDDPFLRFSFNRRTNDPSLVYAPMVSGDLQSWHGGAAHLQETAVVTINSEFERVTCNDLGTFSGSGRTFGHIEVTENIP
jgi:hypothetical protein